jgi:GTPase SAR1 family protein
MEASSETLRMVVLGDGGVGKTNLVLSYTTGRYVGEYDPTIEDSYRKQAKVDEEVVLLEILDTAGPEEFTQLRDQWIRDAKLSLLCFSVSTKNYFERNAITERSFTGDVAVVVRTGSCFQSSGAPSQGRRRTSCFVCNKSGFATSNSRSSF